LDPIGTHLNGVWLAIFILAERDMPRAATNGIPVLENGKIVHGGIVQSLLNLIKLRPFVAKQNHLQQQKYQPFHLPYMVLVPSHITHHPHQYVQNGNSSFLALPLLRPRRVRHSQNRLNGASQGRQEREVVQMHYVESVDPSKGEPKNGADTTLNKYRETFHSLR
jgi:hypothetical protein